MEWQLISVGLLIAAAACYLSRETWRAWRTKRSSCGGGCGCHTDSRAADHGSITIIPTEQLTSRLQSHHRSTPSGRAGERD